MGVNISDIVQKHTTNLKEQSGAVVAVDAYNVIYQFLSGIREYDGNPLKDSHGRITSHLSGIFYRNITMMEQGIRPIYVFDGKPSHLKNRTLEERRLIKEKNYLELQAAIEAGDEERARSLSSRINYVTREITDEAREILGYMGLPYIDAPSEGEAQASVMSRLGLVSGVVSQDYDCLLFGARRVFRNFTMYGRRKVPGRNLYVNVNPEYIDLSEVLETNHISLQQLIDIGILIGTDFNQGLPRVGAKTALNLIKKFGTIHAVLKERGLEIENVDEIRAFFVSPPSI
ncbi:MAG: flap endonuclease-1, partial [Thermoplasmataceae archaeon]